MSGFTPGPWSIRPGDSIVTIFGPLHEIAATSSKPYWEKHDATDLANANLIAAAPDLYEALLAVLTDDEVTGGEVLSSAREAQVRAALAKARSAEFGNIGADGVQS